MSFTVDDFHDLVRLLGQHPEWQAELRRQLLTDELLELPALVRQLAEAQVRTEQRLDALTARVDALTARVDTLVEAQVRTENQLGTLVKQVSALGDRLGTLDGDVLEWRYERYAHAYFSRLARRIRVVDSSRLTNLLDDAADEGRLTDAERDEVILADLVLVGQRPPDRAETYYLVEISAGVGPDDVRRAIDRAAILAKLGRPTIPVVAGRWINYDAREYAQTSGVWQVVDGQTIPPGG